MRDAILEEALAIMKDAGVEGIALRELARRLDYTPGALYRYFDSREQIIAALAEESTVLLAQRLRAATEDRTADPLIAVSEAYLEFAAEEPVRFRLLFLELQSTRGSLDDLPAGNSPYRVVLDVVTSAVAQGRIVSPLGAESIAFVLWSLVHGMAVLESTHLRNFDANFTHMHRLALEQLVNCWTTAGGKSLGRDD